MKPVLQALVLADRIYTDKDSNKRIIAGTFNQITITRPALIESEGAEPTDGNGKGDALKKTEIKGGTDTGSPYLYISLTDVVDDTEIIVQFVNMSKNKVMFQGTAKIQCKLRLATVEIVLPLPPIRVFAAEPGTFSFDVLWRGEILGAHRVIVREEVEKSGDNKQGPENASSA